MNKDVTVLKKKCNPQSAIRNLAVAGKLEEYFELRTMYENIVKDQITIPKATIRNSPNVFGRDLISKLTDPEALSEIYDALKDDIADHTTNPTAYLTAVEFLRSNLSSEEKKELIRSLSAKTKTAVLNKTRNDDMNMSPEYRYAFIPAISSKLSLTDIQMQVLSANLPQANS